MSSEKSNPAATAAASVDKVGPADQKPVANRQTDTHAAAKPAAKV